MKPGIHFSLLGIIAVFVIAITGSCRSDCSKNGKETYFIVSAKPDGAVVRINGVIQDSLLVHPGDKVFWEVSKAEYKTKSGEDSIKVAKSNIVISVSLHKAPKQKASAITSNKNKKTESNGKPKFPWFILCLATVVVLVLGGSFIIIKRNRKATDVPMETDKTGLESAKDDLGKAEKPLGLLDKPIPTDNNHQQNDVPSNATEGPLKSTSVSKKGQDKFAILTNDWEVVGASVQGNGHKTSNTPCQDSCAYEYLGNGWGIAITSDGAGSAEHSDIGSKITIARAMHYLKHLIEEERWIEKKELPTDNTWTRLVVPELRQVRDDIYGFSQKNSIEYKSLSATIIVVVHSPFGLLVAHVGDGRAGCRDMEGNWESIITPHKGEEANQTVFLTTGFWDTPSFLLSGVMVPETRVIRHPVSAFTLMSDGCENTAWLFNQRDDNTGHFYDPNKPFPKFFDPLIESLDSESRDNTPEEEIESNWYSFITEGTRGFMSESDDKTMILGYIRNK